MKFTPGLQLPCSLGPQRAPAPLCCSSSCSSSSEPEGPWRTSSYHLLVRVFIWMRPSCRSWAKGRAQHCHLLQGQGTAGAQLDTLLRKGSAPGLWARTAILLPTRKYLSSAQSVITATDDSFDDGYFYLSSLDSPALCFNNPNAVWRACLWLSSSCSQGNWEACGLPWWFTCLFFQSSVAIWMAACAFGYQLQIRCLLWFLDSLLVL